MSLQEAIKTILQHKGKVTFYHKDRVDSWIESVDLVLYDNEVSCFQFNIKTENEDEAIQKYCEEIFNRNNLALACAGIKKHKLYEGYLDDLENSELKKLMNKYNKEYFNLDYPEFA